MKSVRLIPILILALALLTGCGVFAQSDDTEPISNLVGGNAESLQATTVPATEEQAFGNLIEVPGRVYSVYWEIIGFNARGTGTNELYPSERTIYHYTQEDLDAAIPCVEGEVTEYLNQYYNNVRQCKIIRIALNPTNAWSAARVAMGSHKEWAEENYYAHWISFDIPVEVRPLDESKSNANVMQILFHVTLYRKDATVSDQWQTAGFDLELDFDSTRTFLSQEELEAYACLGGEPFMGYYVQNAFSSTEYEVDGVICFDDVSESNSYRIYIYNEETDQIFCHILKENSHEIIECPKAYGGS